MRRAVFALLILFAPSIAVADDAPTPACRLSPAECAVMLREVAVDAELFAQDQETVGLGLSAQERARALIRRDTDRMSLRFSQLPGPIVAEISRLQACQALAVAAESDPRCR